MNYEPREVRGGGAAVFYTFPQQADQMVEGSGGRESTVVSRAAPISTLPVGLAV